MWGIIGVGDVCEKKSAPAMNKISNSGIKAVMRRDLAKAQDYAIRHNVPHVYRTVEEVLADEEINAVYIATPPSTHKELAIKAAEAGKMVYVEKPMALNYAECSEMLQVFEQKKLPLFVAYYRRALPNFLKVKELIDNGIIGDVRFVQVDLVKPLSHCQPSPEMTSENWRVNPDISGGGYFHDLASHQFDILDFILGKIISAKGFGANQTKDYNADDLIVASFAFESGVLGGGTWCFNSNDSYESDSIHIVGSKGSIEFSTFAHGRVNLKCDHTEDEVFNYLMPEHIQQPLIQQVVSSMLEQGTCSSMGESAARASWVLDQICEKNSFL